MFYQEMKKLIKNKISNSLELVKNIILPITKCDSYHDFIKTNPYARLIRMDKLAGRLLLVLPIWWAVILATESFFAGIIYFIVFGFGAFLMSWIGCIINDIVDKDFDKNVQRCKNRPLASGELSVKQAIKFLIALLTIALIYVLRFSPEVQKICFVAGLMIIAYPFMKRWTHYAQIFLGIVFNLGIIITWFAIDSTPNMIPILLYLMAILWTVAYDTVYGFQDIADDKKQNLRSTAILLGADANETIKKLFQMVIVGISVIGLSAKLNLGFYFIMAITAYYMYSKLKELDIQDPKHCGNFFNANVNMGFMILVAFFIGKF